MLLSQVDCLEDRSRPIRVIVYGSLEGGVVCGVAYELILNVQFHELVEVDLDVLSGSGGEPDLFSAM